MDSREPPSGWFEGREHCLPVRVYYEDTDFTGLVYHGSYVRWFERGRSDFLRAAGAHHTSLIEHDAAFVVTRLAIEFLKSARIDDALVVRTAYDEVRGPRMFIRQSIERAGERLTSAEVEAACIDLRGRARRPPAALIERLRPWLKPRA